MTRTFITVANLYIPLKKNIPCEIAIKIARVNGILDLSSVKGDCLTKCLRCKARIAHGDFGKYGFAMESCREIVEMRDWVLVRDGGTIQSSIIATRTPIARLWLRNHMC